VYLVTGLAAGDVGAYRVAPSTYLTVVPGSPPDRPTVTGDWTLGPEEPPRGMLVTGPWTEVPPR
jgi:hypothetical protein